MELKEVTSLALQHKQALISISQSMGSTHSVIKTLSEILRNSKEETIKERLRDEVFSL